MNRVSDERAHELMSRMWSDLEIQCDLAADLLEARAALRLLLKGCEWENPDWECGHGMNIPKCDDPDCELHAIYEQVRAVLPPGGGCATTTCPPALHLHLDAEGHPITADEVVDHQVKHTLEVFANLREENKRLRVIKTDLLAACESARDLLAEDSLDCEEVADVFDQLRAAIVRAKGETP